MKEFHIYSYRYFCNYQGDCRKSNDDKQRGQRGRGGNTYEYGSQTKGEFEITVYIP